MSSEVVSGVGVGWVHWCELR